MAQLEQSYDVNDLPKSDFEPIPAKLYDGVIHSATLAIVKNNGQQLKVRIDITGPDHQGRVVFDSVTLKNASVQAVEIGKKRLGEYIRAAGIQRLTDTDQLAGTPVRVRVGIEDKNPEYAPKNVVKGIMAPAGSSPMPSGLGSVSNHAAAEEKPAAPKGAKPAWAGK